MLYRSRGGSVVPSSKIKAAATLLIELIITRKSSRHEHISWVTIPQFFLTLSLSFRAPLGMDMLAKFVQVTEPRAQRERCQERDEQTSAGKQGIQPES